MRTNTHDYGHGGAYVRKREVRALAHVCSPMAFIVALLAVLLVPTIALADSSIIWGPSVLPSQDIGVVVNAPDKYRAAALVLGYGDDKVSTWSDEVLAKLSNESTGGAFYTFAEKFGEVGDAVGSDNPLSAVVSAVGNSFWAIAETLYGDEIWLSGYSASEFSSAASALSSVLAGGNAGGGSGGGSGDNVTFVGNWRFAMGSSSYNLVGGNSDFLYSNCTSNVLSDGALPLKPDFSLSVPASRIQNVLDAMTDNDDLYVYISSYDNNSVTLQYYIFNKTATLEYRNTGSIGRVGERDFSFWDNLQYIYNITGAGKYATDVLNRSQYEVTEGSLTVTDSAFADIWVLDASFVYNSSNYLAPTGEISTTPVVPPSNWPEEPEEPEPPELPEPGTNPIVTPTPWAPVISPTFDFDLNITTEPTSNDLIDWVKKIYYELRSFHGDVHDWFDEVGDGIDSLVDAINDAQEQIYDELQTVDDTLRTEGQKIRDYMYQMFHWLKDQLNFQNDTFNDSNIVYWLKRIWGKLGDGDVNVRPVDPTVDPPAWWEWLNRMLDSLLDGLVGVFNELLGGTGDLLEEVIHQFPFSIPWDIAAFLTALAAPPVTPVFDIVIPAVDGWWSQITFHIDLSPYNTTAATVRLMTKLVFAGLLAWKSRELLDMMDVTKW